ncbi:ATP-binding protein, partial [Rhizobium ruizarguesonis]
KDFPRIYEPFQRGEAESVRPMPGLGLGLTITRLLTNTLGGEISVSSVKDEGSTFRVRLMLSAVMRAVAAAPQEKRIV